MSSDQRPGRFLEHTVNDLCRGVACRVSENLCAADEKLCSELYYLSDSLGLDSALELNRAVERRPQEFYVAPG